MYPELIEDNLYQNDISFDSFFPDHIRLLSNKHWTPIPIALQAAKFLAEGSGKILDIGCGIGKFCLSSAFNFPYTSFYGVEQRSELVEYATVAKDFTGLSNVEFICGNMTQVDFKEFDHFYFYNSFYENVDTVNRIDNKLQTTYSLYRYYSNYLHKVLKEKPTGTRIATYHSTELMIPNSFKMMDRSSDYKLKMWIKTGL